MWLVKTLRRSYPIELMSEKKPKRNSKNVTELCKQLRAQLTELEIPKEPRINSAEDIRRQLLLEKLKKQLGELDQ